MADAVPSLPEPAAPRRTLRDVAIVLALSFGLLALLIGIPEVIARYTYKPKSFTGSTLLGSTTLLWEIPRGPANVFGVQTHINNLGMRGPDIQIPKPPGVRRLMTVGDSTVFGVGIPDGRGYPYLTAQMLGPPAEALNGAIPGYSSLQALNVLKQRGLKAQPDLLVIGTLWSDNNFDSFVDKEVLEKNLKQENSFRGYLYRLLKHSQLFRIVERRFVEGRNLRVGTMPGQGQLIGLRRVEINDYVKNLESLFETARGSGAEVLFVLLGNDEDLLHPERPWPWDVYRQAMRDTARRHGSPLIDVPKKIKASGHSVPELLLDHMHPSELGNRLIAEEIVALLQEKRWVQGGSVMTQGTGESIVEYVDPFVRPWDESIKAVPAERFGGPLPTLSGVIRTSKKGLEALELEAIAADDPGQQILDRVSLPGSAPFALTTPTTGRAYLRARLRPRPRPGAPGGDGEIIVLNKSPIPLDHPMWGLLVDLDARTVSFTVDPSAKVGNGTASSGP